MSIKLEVFESDGSINPILFYVYKAVPKDQNYSVQQFMRMAASQIESKTNVPAFTDDRRIYTLSKVDGFISAFPFKINFEKEETLDIENHKKIYADVIDYFIKGKLETIKFADKYRKYTIAGKVTSAYISELKGILKSNDGQFRLRREFDYSVKISGENKVQLWLNVSSRFETKKIIFDYINESKNVIGMKAANCWGKYGETGIITAVGPETVVDELPNFKPLKQYMIETNQASFIKNCPDDSPVVRMKMRNGKEICYYP